MSLKKIWSYALYNVHGIKCYRVSKYFKFYNFCFQEIKIEAAEIAAEEEFSVKDARHPNNKNRNRYRDVYPCKNDRSFSVSLGEYNQPFWGF